MAETQRRKFDADFTNGAVRIVRETGKPIAQVARELGIGKGTLGRWCAIDRRARGEGSGVVVDARPHALKSTLDTVPGRSRSSMPLPANGVVEPMLARQIDALPTTAAGRGLLFEPK